MIIKRTIFTFSVLLCIFAASRLAAGSFLMPWENEDKALLQSLKNNDLITFENLLSKGANPNAILGEKKDEWVMCLATKRGNLNFLKSAVKYSGDINLRLPTPLTDDFYSSYSAPIFCSATYHNNNSFKFLVSMGVNLNIKQDPLATPNPSNEHIDQRLWGKTRYGTPLTNALTWNEYQMVYDILQVKKPNWEELWDLKISIERDNVDPNSEKYQWRLKVMDFLQSQGHDINPERANKERLERKKKWKERF